MALDARVRYTKMMIRESYIQLSAAQDGSAITVKDICDRAGINRSTFYRNYIDIYDLEEQLHTEMLQKMLTFIHERSLDNVQQTLMTILTTMKEHQERYTMLHRIPSHSLLTRIINNCYEDNKDRILRQTSGITETQLKWFYEYICYGCAGLMIDWARSGMQEPPEDVARFTTALIEQNAKVLNIRQTSLPPSDEYEA